MFVEGVCEGDCRGVLGVLVGGVGVGVRVGGGVRGVGVGVNVQTAGGHLLYCMG